MSHPRTRPLILAAILAMTMTSATSARLLIARSVTIGQFGEGPEDFRYPIGLALLESGNLYVSDWKANRVSLVSPAGKMLRLIFPEGPGFRGPLGMDRDQEGNLYVVENRGHRIRKFDAAGNQLQVIGRTGKDPGEFRYPRGIAVAQDGRIFVADTGNRRIQVLDREGSPLSVIEFRPDGAEKAARPRDVALDPRGRTWATYSEENQIVCFAADGSVELAFGEQGSGRGRFDQPRYLGFDVRGNLYVSDYENHRIQKFDEHGRFLYSFGARGSAPGQFHNPEGIVLDERGNLYVADTVNFRVQILELNGIDARRNLGYGAYQRGELDEALEHYGRVLRRLPADREALTRIESIYLSQARRARAEGNIERALALHESLLRIIPGHLASQLAIRELFWLRSRPFIHSMAILGGVLFSALLLLILLYRALRDEIQTWWGAEESEDEAPSDEASPAPGAESARSALRDFAPRPSARRDEEPPRH